MPSATEIDGTETEMMIIPAIEAELLVDPKKSEYLPINFKPLSGGKIVCK